MPVYAVNLSNDEKSSLLEGAPSKKYKQLRRRAVMVNALVLAHLKSSKSKETVTKVVQVGVGDGLECNMLQHAFGSASIIGCDAHPNPNYCGTYVRKLVSDRAGKKTIYLRKHRKNRSSMYRKVGRKTIADAITIDSLTNDEDVSVLWLDCEGHELESLRGASRTLSNVPCLHVEIQDKFKNRRQITKLLKKHGLDIFLNNWSDFVFYRK